MCGYINCVCGKPENIVTRIKLADGSTRNINPQIRTTFWGPDGNQITSEDFLNMLFGDLPNFFKQEEQLRKIWSKPDTRNKLLKELEEAGYSIEQLRDLQVMIDAQKSDLFDVLSYIAFNKEPLERTDRANHATIHLDSYDRKQQAFLDFVLKQYIDEGVGELDDQKLPDLLSLKYHSVADAKQELGDIQTIRNTFIDFQKYLYEASVAI
jgi:type I restriction enzyme R subunit